MTRKKAGTINNSSEMMAADEDHNDDPMSPDSPAASLSAPSSPTSPAKSTPAKRIDPTEVQGFWGQARETDGDVGRVDEDPYYVPSPTRSELELKLEQLKLQKMSFRQRYFPWRPLPWWALLICLCWLFCDLKWRYHESSCTILGLSGLVTLPAIKKTYRGISLCTHPDRLKHTLKRAPSAREEQTGAVLFNRHTQARDRLVRFLEIKEKRAELRRARINKKRKKQNMPSLEEAEAARREEDLQILRKRAFQKGEIPAVDSEDFDEEAAIQFLNDIHGPAEWGALETELKNGRAAYCSEVEGEDWGQLYRELRDLVTSFAGLSEIFEAVGGFVYSYVTFEAGFLNTIMSSLWFLFLYKCVKILCSWVASAGFAAPLYLMGAVLVGPWPTVCRFFVLPFLRFYVFFKEALAELRNSSASNGRSADGTSTGGTKYGDIGDVSTGGTPVKKRSKEGPQNPEKDSSAAGTNNNPGKNSTLGLAVASEERERKVRKRKGGAATAREKQKEEHEIDSQMLSGDEMEGGAGRGGLTKAELILKERKEKELLGAHNDGRATSSTARAGITGSAGNGNGTGGKGANNIGDGGANGGANNIGNGVNSSNGGNNDRMNPDLADELHNFDEMKPRMVDLDMLDVLRMASPTPNKARMQVAGATQFDLLLPLTKPIVPLFMLVSTGQVWSGIMSSMVISQVLRSWVPKLNYETHHVICFAFGFVHTLLGVSAGEVLFFW